MNFIKRLMRWSTDGNMCDKPSGSAPSKPEPEKVEPNISEPIHAIVKALRERPETFDVNIKSVYRERNYHVTDTVTGMMVKVYFTPEFQCIHNHPWMTANEQEYLIQEGQKALRDYASARTCKYRKILRERAMRRYGVQ